MKYRKKPIVINAVQFTGKSHEIIDFEDSFKAVYAPNTITVTATNFLVHTLEGTMEGRINDWLIRGVKGEFYPCKPDIFEATYEPA